LDARLTARGLLTLYCVLQGIGPLAIDLNRTHAANPLWTSHARFHVVWQSLSQLLICICACVLIWWPQPADLQRFYSVVSLMTASLFSFLFAFFCRKLYGGSLSDHNGIRPLGFISTVRYSSLISIWSQSWLDW
jgi:hypothetical protein